MKDHFNQACAFRLLKCGSMQVNTYHSGTLHFNYFLPTISVIVYEIGKFGISFNECHFECICKCFVNWHANDLVLKCLHTGVIDKRSLNPFVGVW